MHLLNCYSNVDLPCYRKIQTKNPITTTIGNRGSRNERIAAITAMTGPNKLRTAITQIAITTHANKEGDPSPDPPDGMKESINSIYRLRRGYCRSIVILLPLTSVTTKLPGRVWPTSMLSSESSFPRILRITTEDMLKGSLVTSTSPVA